MPDSGGIADWDEMNLIASSLPAALAQLRKRMADPTDPLDIFRQFAEVIGSVARLNEGLANQIMNPGTQRTE